ncbi:hypothetical protein [Bacteriovorax sp. Seq25_V]|uniref:hypothetical protein n=1 Tax=Bacteriovorax sp. Seq25_V TaxID=1201288 RepID=UPI0003F55B4E|nr:hypothetical protein [Bacteriovorax sp. Seq25_V]
MKFYRLLVLLFLSTFSTALKAQENVVSNANSSKGYIHFFTGAITYHFFDFSEDAGKFKKDIGDQGKLILHPFLGYEQADIKGEDLRYNAFFIFNDSLGSPALGYNKGYSIRIDQYIDVGYFYGVYGIRQNVWEDNDINLPVRLKLGRNIALVPIIGLKQTLTLPLYDDYTFKTSMAVMPNTATLLIGVAKNF